MNYRVLPGKEPAFEKIFRAVLHALQNVQGHALSRIFREVDEPAHYVILSEWTDRAAFEAFIASEAFRKTADFGRAELLATRPVHVVYENA
jgi:heme-degrading monooxygenase HmoA